MKIKYFYMEDESKKLSYNLERVSYISDPYSLPKFKYNYEFYSQYFLEDITIKGFKNLNENDIKDSIIESLMIEFKCCLNNVMYGDPAGRAYIEALEEENRSKFGVDKSKGNWLEEGTELVDDIAYSKYIKEKYKGQGGFGLIFAYKQEEFIEKKNEISEITSYYEYAIVLLRKEKIMKTKNGN